MLLDCRGSPSTLPWWTNAWHASRFVYDVYHSIDKCGRCLAWISGSADLFLLLRWSCACIVVAWVRNAWFCADWELPSWVHLQVVHQACHLLACPWVDPAWLLLEDLWEDHLGLQGQVGCS